MEIIENSKQPSVDLGDSTRNLARKAEAPLPLPNGSKSEKKAKITSKSSVESMYENGEITDHSYKES